MLEETTLLCPFCNRELSIKLLNVGGKTNYIVSDDCPHCGAKASKIETSLNRSNTKSQFRVEKSYIKLDPRG